MSIDLTVDEEENVGYLNEAYIGPADLVDVEKDEVGDDEYSIVRFTFEALDEDHIGQQFEHAEFPITEQDFENEDANGNSDAEIELRRFLHILSRYLDVDSDTVRENVVRFSGETVPEAWENLRNNVVSAYENFGTTSNTIHIKVYARVKGGYVNMNFPKYPPFVREKPGDPKLEFSSWERQQNLEAEQFRQEDPDSEDEFGEEEEFDFDEAEF